MIVNKTIDKTVNIFLAGLFFFGIVIFVVQLNFLQNIHKRDTSNLSLKEQKLQKKYFNQEMQIIHEEADIELDPNMQYEFYKMEEKYYEIHKKRQEILKRGEPAGFAGKFYKFIGYKS